MNILYSTHCMCCDVLKEKLDAAGIPYTVVDDFDTIKQKGIKTVPVLQVGNTMMGFRMAVEWIKNRSDNK